MRVERRGVLREARVALAWRPEWPVAGVVLLAWAGLILSRARPGAMRTVEADWALMCVAMMVPTTLPAVRHVALNSIPARRWRAVTIYTLCYLATWLAVGVPMSGPARLAQAAGLSDRQVLAAGLAIGALWQLGSPKRTALLACRRPRPLPPSGWRADWACAVFGTSQAGWCVVSCWPLMLLMMMGAHVPLVGMGVVTLMALAERRTADPPRFRRSTAGALVAAMLVVPVLV